jgi:hypothetical protein
MVLAFRKDNSRACRRFRLSPKSTWSPSWDMATRRDSAKSRGDMAFMAVASAAMALVRDVVKPMEPLLGQRLLLLWSASWSNEVRAKDDLLVRRFIIIIPPPPPPPVLEAMLLSVVVLSKESCREQQEVGCFNSWSTASSSSTTAGVSTVMLVGAMPLLTTLGPWWRPPLEEDAILVLSESMLLGVAS